MFSLHVSLSETTPVVVSGVDIFRFEAPWLCPACILSVSLYPTSKQNTCTPEMCGVHVRDINYTPAPTQRCYKPEHTTHTYSIVTVGACAWDIQHLIKAQLPWDLWLHNLGLCPWTQHFTAINSCQVCCNYYIYIPYIPGVE